MNNGGDRLTDLHKNGDDLLCAIEQVSRTSVEACGAAC